MQPSVFHNEVQALIVLMLSDSRSKHYVQHFCLYVWLTYLLVKWRTSVNSSWTQNISVQKKQSHLSKSTTSSCLFLANCWCKRETSPTATVPVYQAGKPYVIIHLFNAVCQTLFAVLKLGHYFLWQNTSWISLSHDRVCRRNSKINIIFYLFSVDALIMKAFMQLVSSQNLFTVAKDRTLRRFSIFIHTFWS